METVEKRGAVRRNKSSAVIVGAVTLVVVTAFVLGALVGRATSRRVGLGPVVPICRTSSLALTATGNGGAGNASYTIVFHNKGPQRCTMRGYPTVVAPLDSKPSVVAPGAGPWPQLVEIARRARETQAGGVLGSNKRLRHYRLPTLVLRARTGVASFTLDWGEEQPNAQTKCWVAREFVVTPPGDHTALTLHRGGLLCTQMFVDPLVAGRSGVKYLK